MVADFTVLIYCMQNQSFSGILQMERMYKYVEQKKGR